MVKFAANDTKTGQPVLGIGLTRQNVEKLLDGIPIEFDTEGAFGLPPLELFIFADENDDALTAAVLAVGSPRLLVNDPALHDPNAVRPADNKGDVN